MESPMPRPITLILLTLVIAVASYALPRPSREAPNERAIDGRFAASALAEPVGSSERGEVERLIRVFERRTREHTDPIDYKFLGRLYLDRARSTGDLAAYTNADVALNRAVALSPDSEALVLLGTVRFTMHDFAGALDLARRVYDADHAELSALLLAGDADLELGRYAEARAEYATLAAALPDAPAVQARLARMAFLSGEDADRLALAAQRAAEKQGAFGPGLAWYAYLRAQIGYDGGVYEEAVAHAREAVAVAPGYHVARSALARSLAATGDLPAAIAEYERAIAIVPLPEYLAALGDLLEMAGDAPGAERNYAAVEAIASLSAGARLYDRQLALFYADHDRNLPAALEIARSSIALRPDIYGYDVLAWALYKNGRFAEARQASDRARTLGTRDARLLYHAGLISRAVGEYGRARAELSEALRISPRFDPLQATLAAAALETLP
jgi:tetratricopeptide (TPR) repeat protein